MNQIASIPTDIRNRIIQSANDLFELNGREIFPTVDQVRRSCKADMNSTSTVMREWRRSQTTQAAPVAVRVPEAIQQINTEAVASLWTKAQELANESLRAAQAAWETERAELDTMRQELADAYEALETEFEQFKIKTETERAAFQEAAKTNANELAAVNAEWKQETTRADQAMAKIGEIERRADDLRIELDRAHRDADQARAALMEQQQATQKLAEERDQAKAELLKFQATTEERHKNAAQEAMRQAERYTKLKTERDEAQQAAIEAQKATAEARERTAELNGKLKATQEQNAVLATHLETIIKQ